MQPLDNRAEIVEVAASLLLRADVLDRLPTPVDDIVAAAGLIEDGGYVLSESKIRQAPKELRALLRSAGRKIRGALDRRERIIHVSPQVELPAQRQFVRCHETMHDALPWQRDLMVLGDTAATLAPHVELRFEREANQGAAELLFQLDLFERVARDYPVDVSTPVALAQVFGASIHASFRRWTETQRGAVCCVVLDPHPVGRGPLTYRRYEVVRSDSWKRQFGGRPSAPLLSVDKHPFLAGLPTLRASAVDTVWHTKDLVGESVELRVQAFTTGYRTFLLLWMPGKEGFVARHRRKPSLVQA